MKINEESKLNIIFSDQNFSIDERSQINSAFSEIVPVNEMLYFRKTAEILPAFLVISLGIIAGTIANNFFKALGSDLYKKAKEIVVQILGRKRGSKLLFEMEYGETKITIESSTNDEVELNKIFDTTGTARDLAIKELENKRTPKMNQLMIYYDDGWKINWGQNLNPPEKFYFYNNEKKWKLSKTSEGP